LEEHKRRERAQAIGLFRFQLICPALEEGLSTKQRRRLVREIAAGTHTDPFGNQVCISRETLDRWIRRYRAGGFEALVPAPRRLAARTDAQVLELAASLKREDPTRTVAQVARILRTATGWAPSESTLLRHFHRLNPMGPSADERPAVFGRFEAADPNELWVGDALHGPRVGDRKTYLFAFLENHSRLAAGYRFGFAEDTVRLAAALRPALAARGVPASIYVDNGSAFCDAWLLRACAKLGVRLVHSAPGRPQGRGKIERWFRMIHPGGDEALACGVGDLDEELFAHAAIALLELNRLFVAWVETEYHRRTHTETGQPPLDRWEAGWDRLGRTPAIPTADDLTEAFLWSEYRVVAKTATVSLHANTYQVDPALVGRKVELVFSPFDLETVEVRYHDKSYGKALPHTISRHAHPKARPENPEPEPPAATVIDYLALTAAAHHEQLRGDERIGYHALYGQDDQIPGQLSIDDFDGVDPEGEVSA
jgi:transposase InsO family protein